jgi:hypothetical protein
MDGILGVHVNPPDKYPKTEGLASMSMHFQRLDLLISSRCLCPGAFVLSVTFLAAGLAGCSRGPAVGEVSGKVTFQGKPVTDGTITFINPTTGYAAEAGLQKDGSYIVATPEGGLVVGEYIVMVNPLIFIDASNPRTPPSPVEKPAPNIPEKYRNQGRTPLRAAVQKGPNTFNVDMTR